MSAAKAFFQGYKRIPSERGDAPSSGDNSFKRCYRIRFFKSRWALLVLLWYLFIYLSTIGGSALHNQMSHESVIDSTNSQLLYSGCTAFTGVLCPVFGYLADAHFGRYKVMVILSIAVTVGELFGCAQLVLYSLHHYVSNPMIALFLILPCYILLRLAMDTAGSFVIIFGMDQLKDASSDELSSYIFWCVWVEMFAAAIVNVAYIPLLHSKIYIPVIVALSSVMAAILWCFLCLNHRYASRRYNREPLAGVSASYGQALQVLKFAVQHKYPLQRSAMTYCEDEEISRIDLGKSRYGGPFTTEQVEDVKTLLWALLIIGISCMASLSLQVQFDKFVTTQFRQHMNWTTVVPEMTVPYTVTGAVTIIVHELVLFPLARRWFPSILKRLGICLLLSIVTPCSQLLIDSMAGHHANSSVCMFQTVNASTTYQTSTGDNETAAVVSQYSEVLPTIFSMVVYTLFHCTLLELIIAQSPERFKSIVVGLMYTVIGFRYLVFDAFAFPFAHLYASVLPQQAVGDFSCDNIFYLALIATSLVGLLLYCVASRKYTYRRRDDVIINENMYAEEYYSQESL
eukprot:Em0005g517a